MTRGAPSWQRQFVALKGDSVCLLNSAPVSDGVAVVGVAWGVALGGSTKTINLDGNIGNKN